MSKTIETININGVYTPVPTQTNKGGKTVNKAKEIFFKAINFTKKIYIKIKSATKKLISTTKEKVQSKKEVKKTFNHVKNFLKNTSLAGSLFLSSAILLSGYTAPLIAGGATYGWIKGSKLDSKTIGEKILNIGWEAVKGVFYAGLASLLFVWGSYYILPFLLSATPELGLLLALLNVAIYA